MMAFPVRFRCVWCLVWLAAAGICPAAQDVMARDLKEKMREAREFGARARELVKGGEVEPVWPQGEGPIVVVVTEPDGSRRVWRIDPADGAKVAAFDHAKLAADLAKRRNVRPVGLRFDEFRIEAEEPDALLFRTGGEAWKFDMGSGVLEAHEMKPEELPLLPPRRVMEGGRRVRDRTTLVVENASGGEIELAWVAGWNETRGHSRIAAGETATISTFDGEAWVARDAGGEALAGFRAGRKRSFARITGKVRGFSGGEGSRRGRPERNLSPDGAWRAAIRGHNLVIEPSDGGGAVALTRDGTADAYYDGPFEWSPDSRHLVCRFTKKVEARTVHIVRSSPPDRLQPELLSIPYPKPGDEIEQPQPRLFDVEAKREVPVDDGLFANPWAIHDLAWRPDSSGFDFVYNERGHQVMRVVGVSAADGKARAIVEERSDTFIDYSQKMYFRRLPETREILWASERGGWNHIYLIDAESGAVKNAITSGEWVVREVVDVDEKRRCVTLKTLGFHKGQDPYQAHFVRVGLDGSGLTALTEADGDHDIRFSPDGRWILATWSRVDQAQVTEIRRADGSLVVEVARADDSALRATGWSPPERFVAKGRDGETDIWGAIIKPRGFDPAKRYAVLEDIYAGPHDFFVPKRFSEWFQMNSMAELGFVVVRIDGMGTNWRSRAFHDVSWKNLMDSGFPDRIAWLKEAAETRPWMDLGRMGIYGGSAGGQSALAGLLNHGDFYQAGVADCGCHDNRMDKMWWNEAWMGWPVDESYARNSNVTHAAKLRNPLMLIVGELDRNVDPASTAQVAAALQREGVLFDFVPVIGAGHGAAETPYGSFRRAEFFTRHLGGPR